MRSKTGLFIFVYILTIALFLLTNSASPVSSDMIDSRSDTYNELNTTSAEAPLLISVYRTDSGTITTLPLESYVTCVVASEIPSGFHSEAIKAQAVAARTYAVAKLRKSTETGCPKIHPLAPVCDSTHCQVYTDKVKLRGKCNWDKISSAVAQTEGQLLYYNNELVEHALFHASSGGKTENSEDVFVSAVPYLKSVDSPYETDYSRNGHGVGMSQQGADGMALAGYSYTEILSHYYSGTYVK